MAQPAKEFYSPAEYLSREEAAAYKSEYYDGEIIMMAGSSDQHNTIAGNVYLALRLAFKGKPCKAYISDMKVRIEQGNLFTYPDVVALCGEQIFMPKRNDVITNPGVIFEVLSASTSKYDRTSKFELYQAVESLKYYVIIDQKRYAVGCYHRTAKNKWELQTYENPTDTIQLPAINFEITVADIYAEVDLSKQRSKIEPHFKK